MWTLAFGHHEDRTPTHGYEPTRRGRDGGVREELAAGASSKMGKSAFGGKPEVQPRKARASAAAAHEVQNLAAKLLIGRVEREHLGNMIVLLQPPEARAGAVARRP